MRSYLLQVICSKALFEIAILFIEKLVNPNWVTIHFPNSNLQSPITPIESHGGRHGKQSVRRVLEAVGADSFWPDKTYTTLCAGCCEGLEGNPLVGVFPLARSLSLSPRWRFINAESSRAGVVFWAK